MVQWINFHWNFIYKLFELFEACLLFIDDSYTMNIKYYHYHTFELLKHFILFHSTLSIPY